MNIFKYQLKHGVQSVMLAPSDQVLSVHEQNGTIQMWAHVTERFEKVPRQFMVLMTGEMHSSIKMKFIGTVMLEGGQFVMHVFEVLS